MFALLVLSVNDLLSFVSILAFLIELVLQHLSVNCFTRVQRVLQHFSFQKYFIFLHLLIHLLLRDCCVELAWVVSFVVFGRLNSLVLFTLEYFLMVFYHSTPLVKIAIFCHGIITLALRMQTHDCFMFLVERLLHTVSHFQRIHNRFGTSSIH